MRAGSLFTGVLGLDQAAAEVFDCELAWACDNDPAAAKVIEYRAGVPNLGDITQVDWTQIEPVGLLTAGWPCQPWSTAGRRKGTEDERALWPEVARAIRALRPGIVVLENVPAIVAAGELARACADLAACGYRFCWVVLGADEVGACHRRNRCFILAVADATGVGHERGRRARDGWPGSADRSDVAADATGDGWHEGRTEPTGLVGRPDAAQCRREAAADAAGARRPAHFAGAPLSGSGAFAGGAGQVEPGGLHRAAADAGRGGQRPDEPDLRAGQPDTTGSGDAGSAVAHSDGDGREVVERIKSGMGTRRDTDGRGQVDWGVYAAAIRRWERVIGRPAPVPRVAGPRGGLKLHPALPEWMQGFPAGWITDVPGVSLNDALKLAGNSVNPYQAVAALRWMAAQLEGAAA